jgi:hypothetical protein
MAWQGVPFSLRGDEVFYHAEMILSKVPKIIVELPSKGWSLEGFLTALVAGGIPALVAWFALRVNKDSLKVQLAHQEIITKMTLNAQLITANRKDNINNLRNITAKFLANVQSAINVTNAINYESRKKERDVDNLMKLKFEQLGYFNEMASLRWNIRLMLRPEDPEYQSVVNAMDALKEIVNNIQETPDGIKLKQAAPIFKTIEEGVRKKIERETDKFESLN